MIAGVTIAGPASPRALADLLHLPDGERASAMPGVGGPAVNNLVRALVDAGTVVELVTLAEEVEERVAFQGPRLRILVGRYRPRARDRARDLFRSERRSVARLISETGGSVVNAQWTYEYALGALARRNRPVLVTARDSPFTILRHQHDLYRAIRAALAVETRLRTGSLVANSPYLASTWRRQMLYPRSIPVVPNVVPAAPGGAATAATHAPTVLDVAGGGPWKNVAALVRAVPEIRRRHPDVRVRLVGSGLGPDSPLAALADSLEVLDAIDFVGELALESVAAEYSSASVFVHPALEESFGLSIAEAMSHGLPIVAGARTGAVPWLLDHGRAGVLVDVRQPSEIAHSVCRLLDDEALRLSLGAAAAERVRTAFSPPAVAARALELYEAAAVDR